MTRLNPGDSAPLFTAATDTGSFTLAEHRGHPVVLFFYPAAMTPGCTTEACDFRDSLAPLRAAGYEVVGISPDPVDVLARFRARDGLTYPLVSDPTRDVMRAYGVWGTKNLYGREVEGVIRSTFVLDAHGVITHALYNVKATGHVGRVRRLLGVG